MKIEYRKLTLSDLSMVVKMNTDFREGFIRPENVKAFLADERNWLFAAVADKQVIGFAYGYELPRLDRDAPMLYIHEVGVLDVYQRQGIGFALMTALKATTRASGICKIFLTTYQNNDAANALYRKAGGEAPAESQGNDTVYWFRID